MNLPGFYIEIMNMLMEEYEHTSMQQWRCMLPVKYCSVKYRVSANPTCIDFTGK